MSAPVAPSPAPRSTALPTPAPATAADGAAKGSGTTAKPAATAAAVQAAPDATGKDSAPAEFKLGPAIVDLLSRQLTIPVGEGALAGTVAGSTFRATLSGPAVPPFQLPAGLGELTFGDSTLTVDMTTKSLTLATEATIGAEDGVHATLEVSARRADAEALGADVDVAVTVTGVPLFGTTVDFAGHLTAGADGLTGAITATLAADAPIAAAGVTFAKDSTFTLSRHDGITVDARMTVGADPSLGFTVAGTLTNAKNWGLRLAMAGGSWQPVDGLTIAPTLTGSLTATNGVVRFHVTAEDQVLSWAQANGLSVSIERLEASNEAAPLSAACPEASDGQFWLLATGRVDYAPAGVDIGGRVCFNLTARTFHVGSEASGDLFAGPGFRLTAAAVDVRGGIGTAVAVSGTAVLHVSSASGTARFNVGFTYVGATFVAGVKVDDLTSLGFKPSDHGTVYVASGDIKSFDTATLFPTSASGTVDIRRGVSVALRFAFPPGLTNALRAIGVPAASTTDVVATAALTPEGFALDATMRFGSQANGLDGLTIFDNGKYAMYLSRLGVNLNIGSSAAVSLTGRATLKLPAVTPNTPPSIVLVDLSASFDLTRTAIGLGFQLTSESGGVWHDALGIPDLTISGLGANLEIVFGGAIPVPSLSVAARSVSLPTRWASALGIEPGATLSLAFDTNPTAPFVALDLSPSPTTGNALLPLKAASSDPTVQRSVVVKTAKLRLAPLGGRTALGETVKPGVQVRFNSTIVGAIVDVDATFDPLSLSFTGSAGLGTLDVSPGVSIPNARLDIDIRPAQQKFAFKVTGTFTDHGFTFDASIAMKLQPSLANAEVSLRVIGGLPRYLQVTGSLDGMVSAGPSGLAINANGAGAVVVGTQNPGSVRVHYTSNTAMAWDSFTGAANDVAKAMKEVFSARADTIAQALTSLHFDQVAVLNALGTAGFTDQLVSSINGFFHPSAIYIWNANAQVLDVSGASTSSSQPVVQYFWNRGANQKWLWIPTDNGYGELVNVNSGMCLTMDFFSTGAGAGLVQYPCSGHAAQQFRFEGVGGIYSVIKNRNSGLVLDVPGGTVRPNTQIIQWYRNGNSNQKWYTTAAVV